jgi:MFS family permease
VKTSTELWRTEGYTAWFTADTAAAIGATLRGFAIPLIAFSVSQSLTTAGWLSTLSVALQQIFGLFGGTLVDRHPRKPLIIGNALIQMLLWASVSLLMLSGRLSMAFLFTVVALSACTTGLIGKATDAALRSIIGAQNYSKARSINEGRDATINMAGSPIGGILYGIQPWLPFVCSAVVYALAGGSAMRLHLHEHLGLSTSPTDKREHKRHLRERTKSSSGTQESRTVTERDIAFESGVAEENGVTPEIGAATNDVAPQSSFLSDFLLGWRWSFHTKRIPLIIASASLLNFGLAGVQYTIQLHLINIGTDPFYIGLMDTGVCIGMLVGAVLANRLSTTAHVGKTMCVSFTLAFLFMVPMLFDNDYWVIFVCYTCMAAPFPMVNSMLFGFVFSKTDENLQGRVSTAISAPAQMLSMFCSGIAGTILPLMGFTATAALFLATMAVSALIATLTPAIRTIPRSSEWADAEL